MRSRWLIATAGFLVVVLLLVAALPWWFGVVFHGTAAKFGVTFESYEPRGYGRFVLTDVRFQRANVVVTAKTLEADTPVLWALRRLRRAPSVVSAGEWTVVVGKPASPTPNRNSGWLLLRTVLWRITDTLDEWLPNASVGPGSVRWPGGELSLVDAQWDHSTMAVKALRFRNITTDARLAFVRADDAIRVIAEDVGRQIGFRFDSRGTQVLGWVTAWDQRASIVARFAATGWIPPEATLIADNLKLPADRLKLAPAYASVDGHARVDWRTDHFFADVALRGEPSQGGNAPPLGVTLRGRGDEQVFTLEAFHADFPGGFAELTEPVSIERSGRIRESAARLSFRADLARQPWFSASGVLAGDARVANGAAAVPIVAFSADAGNLAVGGTAISRAQIGGRVEWPRIFVDRATASGGEGETLDAAGGWNFRTREVLNGRASATLRMTTLGRLVPRNLQLDRVTAEVRLSGPVRELAYEGRASARELRYAGLNPASVEASWRGTGERIESFSAEAAFGEGAIRASGAADTAGVRLTSLAIEERGIACMRLAAPSQITWRPALSVNTFRMEGPGAAIDAGVQWGRSGRIAVAIRGIPSRWLAHFVPLKGPAWTIESFALTGEWNGGPMTYSTAGGFAAQLVESRSASLNYSARGDANGLVVEALHGVESGNAVVNASGRVPVRFSPGNGELVSVDANGSLALQATTVPNAAFWQQLEAMTGVELRAPTLKADVSGTWSKPRGTLALTAEKAAMDPKRFARPLPSVEAVDLACVADPDGVTLQRFTFTVEQQLVRISGRLPLTEKWRELTADPMRVLGTGAQLRIEVPDAEVAMFSKFLSAALAPAGRLQADLGVKGGELSGFLRIHNAASRPLGPLGVLQDVNADVEFSGPRILLRRVTATTGGQPVAVSGTVDLPSSDWLAGRPGVPKYDVEIKGTNVPFVRQSALLLRGDVALRLRTPAEGAPRISGNVVLRDSLFLSDIRAFLPRGATPSPSRRPPYFSVDIAPLNTWELDVEISGTRFMRVRMPVFAGVTSARFHLGGTLREPRAVGDATIDEGQVSMPFATFVVSQGVVRLTEENPYEPTVFVRGTGRHFGYDLAMEVSGNASAPNIMFTSSPPLDSDQVLLMVMTGATPSDTATTSLTHRAVQIGAFFGQSMLGSLTGNAGRPDRLTIESGEKISRQGRETYSIEYELGDRWTLTGEYDEFDEYNAGFKWRLAPKKKER